MHRESRYLKLLHMFVVTFTVALLLPRLASLCFDGFDPEPQVRSSYILEQEYRNLELKWTAAGAVLGVILAVLSWNQLIRKHPEWDERIIAMGCLLLLILQVFAHELLLSLALIVSA